MIEGLPISDKIKLIKPVLKKIVSIFNAEDPSCKFGVKGQMIISVNPDFC